MKTAVLLWPLLIVAACFGKEPSVPSEAEKEAAAILSSAFEDRGESWFSVVRIGNPAQERLVELQHATHYLRREVVTQADRLNGVQERFVLDVECAQHRTWGNGQWLPWENGSAGKVEYINRNLPGGAKGYWTIQLERKNDSWTWRSMSPFRTLVTEPLIRQFLMRQAGV